MSIELGNLMEEEWCDVIYSLWESFIALPCLVVNPEGGFMATSVTPEDVESGFPSR